MELWMYPNWKGKHVFLPLTCTDSIQAYFSYIQVGTREGPSGLKSSSSGYMHNRQTVSSKWTLRRISIYHLMPMHNQTHIWLKPEELWERTCRVEKWLYNCQSRQIAILDMPLNNQTLPSFSWLPQREVPNNKHNSGHFLTYVVHCYLDKVLSSLGYHSALNAVMKYLCFVYTLHCIWNII